MNESQELCASLIISTTYKRNDAKKPPSHYSTVSSVNLEFFVNS